MKAIVYSQNGLPISDENALYDLDVAQPQPGARDLLVKISAIAVNPVDTKVRHGAPTDKPRILGWDAVGVVEAVGSDVTLFQPGDEVFYAGDITRAGSYAEYGLVE
jgi:NADPH:quinone reductase and related Zn-dependent oxidoreductases